MLKTGPILVDGRLAKDSGMHVNPDESVIEIFEERLNYREFVYVMMNKPAGVISATFDNKLKTVVDILPEEYNCFGLFPVGRLDIDTEGLLILTNDGQLAHDLLSPKKHVPKRYYALLTGQSGKKTELPSKKGLCLTTVIKRFPPGLK